MNGLLFVDGQGRYRVWPDTDRYRLFKNSNGVTYEWVITELGMQCMQKREIMVALKCCWMEQEKEGQANIWIFDREGLFLSSTGWFGSGLELWNTGSKVWSG